MHQEPNSRAINIVDDSTGDTDEDEDDEEKRTLFLANFDERVTEELLYEVFLQAGPIESVRIPKENGGRQRNFGFVTYIHKCSASYAMQLLSGLMLFRKALVIKFKYSPTQSQRRSLPSDCEPIVQRRSFGNDNLGLSREGTFPGYNDISMNMNPFKQQSPTLIKHDRRSGGIDVDQPRDVAGHCDTSVVNNPFKQQSPPSSSYSQAVGRKSGGSDLDWTTSNTGGGKREKNQIAKHTTRIHQSTSPYAHGDQSRYSGVGSGNRRHHHQNTSNRRSEQRNRRR